MALNNPLFFILATATFLAIADFAIGQADQAAYRMRCRRNETYNQCGNHCDPNCADPPGGKACILVCGPPACACRQGYARNATGQCVLQADCPNNGGVPTNPCAAALCPPNTHCVPRQVQCFAPPCPPIPDCVPNAGGASNSAGDSAAAGSD